MDEILKYKNKEARHKRVHTAQILKYSFRRGKLIYGVINQDGSLRNRIQVVTRKSTGKISEVQVCFFFKTRYNVHTRKFTKF